MRIVTKHTTVINAYTKPLSVSVNDDFILSSTAILKDFTIYYGFNKTDHISSPVHERSGNYLVMGTHGKAAPGRRAQYKAGS